MTDGDHSDPTPDELSADTIEAAAGPVEEDKRIQIGLEDGRTVVARVRLVQDGPHECPIDGCLKRYETERALQTHLGRTHPDATSRTCPECADEFSPPPSRTQTYCSPECYQASLTQEKVCPACDRPFETAPEGTKRERSYCSQWCVYEDRRSDTRPDSYPAARSELEAEDHEGDALLGRLLSALGPEWSRASVRMRYAIDYEGETYETAAEQVASEDDVDKIQGEMIRQYIQQLIDVDDDISNRLEVAMGLEAIDEAESLTEAGQMLRLSRRRTSNLLSKLGVKDDVDSFSGKRASIRKRATDGGE